jgi:hypothetical protein
MYSTSLKAAGSFRDEVFGFLNSPSRIMALGSSEPILEISTRKLRGG